MVEVLLQVGIAVLSGVSIALLSIGGAAERWGFAVGLLAQPLWLFSLWEGSLWGMFAGTVCFTAAYLWGVWRTWVAPWIDRRVCDALDGDLWDRR